MSDVFVSYKAEDRRRLQPLVQALQADGYSVWWDEHIGAGDDWRRTIEQQLDSARCVIVVWSKRSVGPEGRFVRDEASRAQARGVYVPVLIDAVQPPLGFGESQAASLRGWKGDRSDSRYESILASVRHMAGPPSAGLGAPPAAKSGLSRRTMVAGGAAATVAVVGVGGWALLRRGSAGGSDSIAVLPFANLSGDPAQAYFSDGIAEELRAALSRIAGLKVVARTSSEAVRNEDARTAAGKLGVSNILTGSVRRSAATLRISAQLIDGRKGLELWSENYDRPGGDSLQIQTDIAARVAAALRVRLGVGGDKQLFEGGTTNPEAHDLLLKAEAYSRQNEGLEALQRSIGMVDAALALDPRYADALAAKARMLKVWGGALTSSAEEARQLYREAELTARRAIELAPHSRSGYAILGDILYEQLKPRAGLVQYQKTLSLPGSDSVLSGYAVFLAELKHSDEALRVIDRAIAVDPLNPLSFSWKAYILAAARRYPEAIEVMRQMATLAPGRNQSARLGYYAMLLGDYDEAAKLLRASTNEGSIVLANRAALAVRLGDRSEAEHLLRQIELEGDYGYFQMAGVLAQLGRKDEAFAALDKAWDNRDSGLTTLLVDPLLDPLRADPRFDAIVKRIDFPV